MYARTVEGRNRPLTLAVSGMLWNKSLVMTDVETGSLWSHLLGRAMQGTLKGTELTALPSEIVTWEAWLRSHPQTTVLNLPRTATQFVKEFYRHPDQVVFGLLVEGQPYSVSLVVLKESPLLNLDLSRSTLLVTFDPDSTAAHVFSRTVNGRVLKFVPADVGRMKDRQTGTVWDRNTGIALKGPLKGAELEQRIGIISYTRAWQTFHPDSRIVKPTAASGPENGRSDNKN